MKVSLDDELIDKILADDEESMVMVSLFTDKYDEEKSERGFWADSPSLSNSGRMGSTLYEFERSVISNQVISGMKDAALEAVRWMENDGIVRSIEVKVDRQSNERILLRVNQKVIRIEL